MSADLLAALGALAERVRQTPRRNDPFHVALDIADDIEALIAAHQPAEPEWDRDALIAALAGEPQAMTLSHDRLVLQRKDEGTDARVVLVRCPHTIGLCFETDDYLGMLPCPCNDRSEVLAELVAR